MKTIKKLLGLLLAATLACALALPAFAEDTTYTISVESGSKHTYQVYQIFTGTVQTEHLVDIKWGKNGTGDEGESVASTVLDALEAVDTTTASDQQKLAVIEQYVNLSSTAYGEVSDKTPLEDVPSGYYLVKDKDDTVAAADAYTLYLVSVVKEDATITPKSSAPTVEKKVQENAKLVENPDNVYAPQYNDVADWCIGDEVPFQLIGSVPDMTYYETYQYTFVDTMDDSLDFEPTSLHVYAAADKAGTNKAEITTGYDVAQTTAPKGFTVSFTDLKSVVAALEKANEAEYSFIIVEYKATLNSGAEIGLPGNVNGVKLQFSNNPNVSGEGDTHPKGETTVDKVVVFTYELDLTKVDGETLENGKIVDDTKKLPNAKFRLKNIEDQFVIVDTNGKVTGWADLEANGSILESDANGVFKVIGLDSGTYTLEEVEAPNTYNKLLEPITIVLTAATFNNQSWDTFEPDKALTKLEIKIDEEDTTTGDVTTGAVSAVISNNKGVQLPSTGGIGTALFYVIGGGLMLAALVLLVTKKRLSKNG